MRILPSFRSLLFAFVVLAISAASFAQVSISIRIGPPALPVYEQPLCPAEGYIWTPGYWAYDYDYGDYYWVPGTWVLAPEPGYLWTPGYWGWGGDRFLFHEGYWGPRVGFYGGINYGFGYFGNGYEGGRWDHDRFFYNRSVNNVNVTNIHNVYNTTVINNTTVNRISYNGGDGGINARPTHEEEAVERQRHIPPVGAQTQHLQAARANPELRASANHGRPPVAATPRPGAFNDRGVVPAKEAGAPYHPEANRAAEQPRGNSSVPRPGNNVPRPQPQVTQRILHPIPALLPQTRETRNRTKDTSNSRKSSTRSSSRSTRDSSKSRSRTTSGWRNSGPMKRGISRWSKGTNNRPSNWSKDTSSSSSTCRKGSNRRTGISLSLRDRTIRRWNTSYRVSYRTA